MTEFFKYDKTTSSGKLVGTGTACTVWIGQILWNVNVCMDSVKVCESMN